MNLRCLLAGHDYRRQDWIPDDALAAACDEAFERGPGGIMAAAVPCHRCGHVWYRYPPGTPLADRIRGEARQWETFDRRCAKTDTLAQRMRTWDLIARLYAIADRVEAGGGNGA